MSIPQSDLELDSHEEPDPFVEDCVVPAQIRSWILDCEENHGIRCNSTEHQSAAPATELKLIDVVDHCIVDAPHDARYFALSYMWGGVTQMLLTTENGVGLSLPGSLDQHWSHIPAVIQDAVYFVASLNERYLWVDSLCIIQNDMNMKHHQILQMGSIYNGAVASLVGVVGMNAHSGLAGVRSSTRIPEITRLQYENVYLINPGFEEYISLRKPRDNSPFVKLGRRMKGRHVDLNSQLMQSTYSSRAWTYQERLLSRRCIYFMENMVYYHCRSAIRGENKATPYSRKSQNIRPLCLFMADPIFSGDPLHFQRTLGAIYAGIITEFTRKKLSFPIDVLDAFAGIASAMEKLCSWRVVAGMPENLLDYALLWTPTGPSQRRLEQQLDNPFPSWSWAGWCAEVDYENLLRTETGYEPFLADMQSLVHQLTIVDRDGPRRIQGSVKVNELFAALAIKAGSSLRTDLSYWLNRLSHTQTPKNVLVFQALTWPFRDCVSITTKTGKPFLSASRPSLGPIQRTFVEFDIDFSGVISHHGTLYGLDSEIDLTGDLSDYDVAFLSISKGEGEDFAEWNPNIGDTNIILIKWTGDFAERVAIGHLGGILIMETLSYLKSRGHRVFRKLGDEDLGLGHDYLLSFCKWKTIRLI